MKLKRITIATALCGLLLSPFSYAEKASFSQEQKKAIQGVIHDYLLQYPEVLIEASEVLQKKQQQALQKSAEGAIEKHAASIFADSKAIAGNPKGNVTLVEFFDYQCGYCKTMTPIVNNLIKENKELRVIYKDYPIFGANSVNAAKAALAAAIQGKYSAMQEALMAQKERMSDSVIEKAAKAADLDMVAFKKDMQKKEILRAIIQNGKLAKSLQLGGTPAFIIASTPQGKFVPGTKAIFIPSAVSKEALQQLIQKAMNS